MAGKSHWRSTCEDYIIMSEILQFPNETLWQAFVLGGRAHSSYLVLLVMAVRWEECSSY